MGNPEYGWPWFISSHSWEIPPWDERIAKDPYRVALSCLIWLCKQPPELFIDRQEPPPDDLFSAKRQRVREVAKKVMSIRAKGMVDIRKELAVINPISVRRAWAIMGGIDCKNRQSLTSRPRR